MKIIQRKQWVVVTSSGQIWPESVYGLYTEREAHRVAEDLNDFVTTAGFAFVRKLEKHLAV